MSGISEEQSFLARQSGRLDEATDDDISLRLSTPGDWQAQTLPPAPIEKAWAAVFKINVAITFFSVVILAGGATATGQLLGVYMDLASWIPVFGIYILLFAIILLVTLKWCILRAVSSCSRQILQISFAVFIVVCMANVKWMLNSGAVLGAIFVAVVCAVIARLFFRRGRVNFAAENLKVAGLAVRSVPKVFAWSICLAVVRFAWLVVTGIALAGSVAAFQTVHAPDGTTYPGADCNTIIKKTNEETEVEYCKCNGTVISDDSGCSYSRFRDTLLVCFWMASMGWGFVICTNIMAAAVARSVASWLSSPDDVEPARRSFQYVVKSSLGPLCKGSAMDGFMELLNQATQSLPYIFGVLSCQTVFLLFSESSVLFDILTMNADYLPEGSLEYVLQPLGAFGCPLLFLKLVVNYGLKYTAIFVGMYRLSFLEAANRTKMLFCRVGLTLLVNDMLVGMSLLLISLPPFSLYLFIVCYSNEEDGLALSLEETVILCVVAITSAVCGLILLPVIEVVLYAYKAVFICFVQDPEVLAANHDRQVYDGLNKAWTDMHRSHPLTTGNTEGDIEL